MTLPSRRKGRGQQEPHYPFELIPGESRFGLDPRRERYRAYSERWLFAKAAASGS